MKNEVVYNFGKCCTGPALKLDELKCKSDKVRTPNGLLEKLKVDFCADFV